MTFLALPTSGFFIDTQSQIVDFKNKVINLIVCVYVDFDYSLVEPGYNGRKFCLEHIKNTEVYSLAIDD
jgi:hypothetical protein